MNHGGSLMLREVREVIDKHIAANTAALVDELTARMDSELARKDSEWEAARDKASSEAVERERLRFVAEVEMVRESTARDTRVAVAESFNQALRRIRQASTSAAALDIVLESTAPYAAKAVVLEVENGQARSLGVRGSETGEFTFRLETAPAVLSVCETRDPQVALGSEIELSSELAGALALEGEVGDTARKTYLFPVLTRHEVIAVLVVSGEAASAALVPSAPGLVLSAMELLTEAAGMKIEALEAEMSRALNPLKPLSGLKLVQIDQPSVPETAEAPRLSWDDLSPEDQKLHLQAQRVARVKVAEMRLYHSEELRNGVFQDDIYGALRSEIDRARADFLQTFLLKSPTMVDYLHIEILRSLAHEDDRLLGRDYPGPMV